MKSKIKSWIVALWKGPITHRKVRDCPYTGKRTFLSYERLSAEDSFGLYLINNIASTAGQKLIPIKKEKGGER